jgi:hypothetical protein
MLIEILLALIKDDLRQGQMLLEDLDHLVPYHGDEEDDSEFKSVIDLINPSNKILQASHTLTNCRRNSSVQRQSARPAATSV